MPLLAVATGRRVRRRGDDVRQPGCGVRDPRRYGAWPWHRRRAGSRRAGRWCGGVGCRSDSLPGLPLPRPRDAERAVSRSLSSALEQVGALLRSGERRAPIGRSRPVTRFTSSWHGSLMRASPRRPTSGLAPRRWHLRRSIDAEDRRIAQLDLLPNSMLSLVRAVTGAIDDGESLPAALTDRIARFARALRELAEMPQPWPEPIVRDAARAARDRSTTRRHNVSTAAQPSHPSCVPADATFLPSPNASAEPRFARMEPRSDPTGAHRSGAPRLPVPDPWCWAVDERPRSARDRLLGRYPHACATRASDDVSHALWRTGHAHVAVVGTPCAKSSGSCSAEDCALGAAVHNRQEECLTPTLSVESALTCTPTNRRSQLFDQGTGELTTRPLVGRPHELLPVLRDIERLAWMVYEAGERLWARTRRASGRDRDGGVRSGLR